MAKIRNMPVSKAAKRNRFGTPSLDAEPNNRLGKRMLKSEARKAEKQRPK